MSDLKTYISERRARDAAFDEGFDDGYKAFKIGVLLKQAREESGLTQAELAERLHTQKSAISRIENHAEDIRLSTLKKFAAFSWPFDRSDYPLKSTTSLKVDRHPVGAVSDRDQCR